MRRRISAIFLSPKRFIWAEEGRRAKHARGFHTNRHSLTSAPSNTDVSEEVKRKIVGHESSEVHAIYTHHEQETLARAIGKLPNV